MGAKRFKISWVQCGMALAGNTRPSLFRIYDDCSLRPGIHGEPAELSNTPGRKTEMGC